MHDDTLDIHIRSAARPGVETERLLGDLVGACWPGGTADRSDPIARGWLRQFAAIIPLGDASASLSMCACAASAAGVGVGAGEPGRCPACN